MSSYTEDDAFDYYAAILRLLKDGAGDPIEAAERFASKGLTAIVSTDAFVKAVVETLAPSTDKKRRKLAKRLREAIDRGHRNRTGHVLDDESLERKTRLNERVEYKMLDAEAAEIVKARRVEPVAIPAFVRLDQVGEDDTAPPALIDRIMPANGNVALAAQYKAGKSTMLQNVTRALVDGVDFLDEFAVDERRRVTILDFELPKTTLDHWLRGQGIENAADVTLVSLRGRAAAFNILDDDTRSRWAVQLADVGTQTLLIDPLRPILAGLGLNEWNEMGPLLQAFDALKEEAGIRELVVAQHYGHHAQRAAGDSRLLGWADAIWNLTLEDPSDSRSFRFFEAYGRDVDQQRGLVSLYDERRLAFAHDAGMSKDERYVEALLEWLLAHPDAKRTDIESAGIKGINSKSFVRIRDRAADRLTERTGDKNAKHYSVAERTTGTATLAVKNPDPTAKKKGKKK